MSLLRQGKACALTIYVGEADQWHGTTLYVAIVQYLRERGCAGATVTRAIAGYGASAKLYTSGKLQWFSEAPVIIQVIDQPNRLHRLLPHLQEMIGGGLMTLQEVEVLKYTHVRAYEIPTRLPVSSIMESSVIAVEPTTSIDTVIDLLLDAPFRTLPVVDGQKRLQGIISTGDLINAGALPMRRGLLRKALELDDQSAEAVGVPLEQAKHSLMTAQDVMNRQVLPVGPDDSVREVAQIMIDTGLHRLPVVSADGVLLGMITRADMLQVVVTSPLVSPDISTKAQPSGENVVNRGMPPQKCPIGDYASPDVTTVYARTPLNEVIDALVLSPLKRVVVVDEERRVVGIISDVDVLAHIQTESRPGFLTWLASWAKGTPERVPAGVLRSQTEKARVAADVMNRDVATVAENASVQQTVEYMMTTHCKVLPVLDAKQRLAGIVGRSDVLRLLLKS